MRPDCLIEHLQRAKVGRREMLRAAASVGALGALAALGFHPPSANALRRSRAADNLLAVPGEEFTDAMFDVAAVKNGAWDDTAFYTKGDQRGTFNEVTPERTAAALGLLQPGRPVLTYSLGELLFNGFPAFPASPPRLYEQRLTVLGYQPPDGFGGVLVAPTGVASNELTLHEERFKVPDKLLSAGMPYTGTYQVGTQIDNLNHAGVRDVFYGGYRGPDIAEAWGTNRLGAEHMGPIVTRGVVVDVLGLKLAGQETAALSQAGNGQPILRDDYRITVEDIEAALRRQETPAIEAGDVVLFRTGWNQLLEPRDPNQADQPVAAGEPSHPAHADHRRYLAGEPGIYLREARYLAARRPAIIGSDTWGLELLPGVDQNVFGPVHQELLVHYGIRIGEGIVTDALVRESIYEFVFIVTPQNALGATAGNSPPAALAQRPTGTKTLPVTS